MTLRNITLLLLSAAAVSACNHDSSPGTQDDMTIPAKLTFNLRPEEKLQTLSDTDVQELAKTFNDSDTNLQIGSVLNAVLPKPESNDTRNSSPDNEVTKQFAAKVEAAKTDGKCKVQVVDKPSPELKSPKDFKAGAVIINSTNSSLSGVQCPMLANKSKTDVTRVKSAKLSADNKISTYAGFFEVVGTEGVTIQDATLPKQDYNTSVRLSGPSTQNEKGEMQTFIKGNYHVDSTVAGGQKLDVTCSLETLGKGMESTDDNSESNAHCAFKNLRSGRTWYISQHAVTVDKKKTVEEFYIGNRKMTKDEWNKLMPNFASKD